MQKQFCFKPNQHPQLYKKYVGSLLTSKTPLREELTRDELRTSSLPQLKHPHLHLAQAESSGRREANSSSSRAQRTAALAQRTEALAQHSLGDPAGEALLRLPALETGPGLPPATL